MPPNWIRLLLERGADPSIRGEIVPFDAEGLVVTPLATGQMREAVVDAQTRWWNNFMTLWESTARKMRSGTFVGPGICRKWRPVCGEAMFLIGA